MCGSLRWSESGQIALMDAMIFFLAAGVICSVMVSSAFGRAYEEADEQIGATGDRAASILRVFLDASIGFEAVVEIHGGEVSISARAVVADCLAAEVAAVQAGSAMETFSSLNEILLETLARICGAYFAPYLSVFDLAQSGYDVVISLPCTPPDSSDLHSAFCPLIGKNGTELLVVLVLCPSAAPEDF